MNAPVLLIASLSLILLSAANAALAPASAPAAFQLHSGALQRGAGSAIRSALRASVGENDPAASTSASALAPGDRVLVVGGTGGVGQLVTKKLRSRSSGYSVRVASRDVARGVETIADEGVEVVRLSLVGDDASSDEELTLAMDGCQAIVISLGTTAFPTMKWRGGNTPQAIDDEAVARVASAASNLGTVKRIVLLTSVGVQRTDEMPFLILNLFGVLDAKRAGEEAVRAAAALGGFGYAIIRPGRLVGGPYTNYDLAKLMQIEGGAENGVTIEAGDSLLGDCKRDACAEAVLQAMERNECRNAAFSIVSNEERALSDEEWAGVFSKIGQ